MNRSVNKRWDNSGQKLRYRCEDRGVSPVPQVAWDDPPIGCIGQSRGLTGLSH